MAKLIMTVEEMQDREKWLAARRLGLGGSDASIIAGVNPWGTLFGLWLEKTGQSTSDDKDKTQEENERMMWGHRLEENVAQYFAEVNNKKIRRCGLMQSEEYPWLLASPDRLIVGESAGLEIKTSASWNKDEWVDDEIPAHYIMQCYHYMNCLNLDRYYICCLLGGQHYVQKCIERKDVEDDLKALLELEKDFWENYVVPKELPAVDGTKRCTEAIVNKFPGKYNEKGENIIELDAIFTQKIEDIKKLEADIDLMQKNVDKMKNDIRLQMGDMVFAHASYWNVSFKPVSSTRVDSKKLKERYPNIYAECSKPSSTRVLRIEQSKDPKRLGGN